MSEERKTLFSVLMVPEAVRLENAIAMKGESSFLDRLGDPAIAMKFLRTSLCGSYLFARFAVPSYAAAVFASLRDFPPADDETGVLLSEIVQAVQGELFNNNIFGRPGECHSHYHDMLEAYEAAGGNMDQVKQFIRLESYHGFLTAMERSGLWSHGSKQYAHSLLRCCEDPLATMILMPANELLAPRVYERALKALCREERFDKFRTFLERHVSLDTDDHGPVVLDWLDLYLQKKRPKSSEVSIAARKALAYIAGDRLPGT